MSVKAINSANSVNKQHKSLNDRKNSNNQQTFTGSFNPVVMLMDGIDKGGFAASFITQDGIGMVAPRIYEGLNRNRKKDENGKRNISDHRYQRARASLLRQNRAAEAHHQK